MITRLLLLEDSQVRSYRPPQDSEMARVLIPVLLFVVGIVLLPLVGKFVLLFITIIVGGYFLNKATEQKPELEKSVIEFAADSITLMYTDKEDVHIELSSLNSLEIWSDFYPGYILPQQNATISDGHIQITMWLKDGSSLTKQCRINDKLQYNATIYAVKVWYSKGIAIKEFVTFRKYFGFLMDRQSNYSYAELQAAKAELGIS